MTRRAAPNRPDKPQAIRKSLDAETCREAATKLAQVDPALADVLNRLGPPPLWKRPANFATLVRIVLEQQVSLTSAKSALDRVARLCSGRINALEIEALGQQRLRDAGITRQKARYICQLAADVNSRALEVAKLRHQSDERVRAEITSRLGLGDWSADVFLILALGRRDVLPVGDLALVKGMTELDGGDYSDRQSVIDRADLWRPFRSVATRMVWQLYLDRRGQDVP